MFDKYYQDELQYLRELGEEFSRAHPAAGHFLSGPGRDPDVERLLEGFAFLSARVRQKLDDEFPELTHGLMHLMWPHYLRPVPSMAILEFAPMMQAVRQSHRIPAGTEVESVPVEGTPCRFRTSSDVVVHPLSIESVGMEALPSGHSALRLGFRLHNQARPERLQLSSLRLHLHGDAPVSHALRLHLSSHVAEVRVSQAAGAGPWRPLSLAAPTFEDAEALIPYPHGSSPGYRLLQEYFAFPDRFLFVDLGGLEALAQLSIADRFEVEVRFDRQLPLTLRPTAEQIRLYCTPIANLFAHEADPIRLDRTQTEYRLRPAGANPFHYEIHTIDRVTTYAPGTAEERELPSFYSFDHRGGAYYVPRLRSSVVDDRVDTWISFVDAHGVTASPEAETVAVAVTCTNRRLAEALRAGDVNVPTDSSPAFVAFRNLAPPTTSVPPPLDSDLPWRLISHLALNHLSLTSLEALRGILQLYDFHAARDPRAARAGARRIEGISRIDSAPAERLMRGGVVRGTAVTLDVLEDHFAGPGDLHLFSSVLDQLIGLHASLNCYTELTVRGVQKGEVSTWPCRTGRDRL